ncbi:myeloid cell surface antigen CD33 isoform X3 [Xenopus laevis]|uniref:Ig-like domain-containing protein n=2 Tax=Xenopus laevis TaxID=8355 RepID=A0A974HCX4_XENLA|nr:myeloid cell surface antigen CD33 isoform X3 [Xenopus laevis]OCT73323.1 hypothetical protein XELAEV_18036305mg [Xenopus laevis]
MGVRRSWFYCEYRIIFLLIFLMQWKGRNFQGQKEIVDGFKIEAPAEVTVQRGLCVLIPCNFTVGPGFTLTKEAIGIWYKINVPVAASTDSSQFPDTTNGRFIFTGKVSAGDCSFSISDAQPGDAAQYHFRLVDRDSYSYIGIQPNVSVTDLKEPDISPTKYLIAGEEVTVTCTAPTDCPGLSPTFTWEGSVNTENTQNNKLRHQDRNFPYWSTITFTPSLSDHNSSLTCTVTYKNESATTSITLNVISAQKPQTNLLIAGLCIAFIMLMVVTTVFIFRWMRKKKELQDRTTKEMPKSDGDVIVNDIENMKSSSNESYMDTEEAKQDRDHSDSYINNEKEVQYASLDFSKIKPTEAPQTEIIYSEVKRN